MNSTYTIHNILATNEKNIENKINTVMHVSSCADSKQCATNKYSLPLGPGIPIQTWAK